MQHDVHNEPDAAALGQQSGPPQPPTMAQQIEDFARMMFLHQIAVGFPIDVTREMAELSESIKEAEHNYWIEIHVASSSYRLTEQGKRLHDSYINEAQELIRRYDIFGDVDIAVSGQIYFDTGLGKDLRVPVWELSGVDPFRGRFLLGLSDGEWDRNPDWPQHYKQEGWYRDIFDVVEQAPSIEEIGEHMLRSVIDAGNAIVRKDPLQTDH
jgi:hypothetical protein